MAQLDLSPELGFEVLTRFWARVAFPDDPADRDACWLWTGYIQRGGYGVLVTKAASGRWHHSMAHRLSYLLYVGRLLPDHDVCHRCDVRACVRPDHLFLGTRLDNMRDAQRKGRTSRGATSFHAKLTEAEVRAIREARRQGVQGQVLAERYGVSENTISGIIHGRTWAHLKDDPGPR